MHGNTGSIRALPNRLLGSPDIYEHENREPEQSINFVACHDGFTLNDVVSYNSKHNEANGENNRDGADNNVSWNHGVEGPAGDADIESLRERQMKNLIGYTLLAMGTPMLQMGDEVRRTQFGNNNAYAQDNSLSWFDWNLVQTNAGLLRFVREMIRFRLRHAAESEDEGDTLVEELRSAHIHWHGIQLNQPDWGFDSRSLAVTLTSEGHRPLHILLNTYWEALHFALPPGYKWKRVIDTSLPSPDDIVPVKNASPVRASRYTAGPRSLVVLVG